MTISGALDYLKTSRSASKCRDEQITLEGLWDVIARACTPDARRWAEKIETVVAYVAAGNYAFTRDNCRKILDKRKYLTWILSDGDSMQYAKRTAEGQYRLIQLSRSHPELDSYEVHSAVITLADYMDQCGNPDEELLSALKSFGYPGVQYVRGEYGGSADQIICECLFESLIWTPADTCLFAGKKEECASYITDYIWKN